MPRMKQFEHLKIPLEDINSATNNFADENCIGRGGFGKVYKGEIFHSEGKMLVALKRLDREFGQGDPEFWKEIMMLSLYKHKNIVSLLGYCDDCGEKILMYEYLPKKSLDQYLKSSELTWVRRLKICIGAARGLACLHDATGTLQRVLHRDIKSSNILLDENWDAKISDFGLSKFGPANQQITFLVSHAVGTLGYCDPLYAETGFLTKESDVYSFGVVLFEILCGRLCMDNKDKHRSLVGLARQSYEEKTINAIIYANIKDEIYPDSLKVFATIAYNCLKRDREERPLMTEIVKSLEIALKSQVEERDISPDIFEEPELDPIKTMKQGILNVKVLRAMDLMTKSSSGACDPYVILRVTEGWPSFKKTTVKRNNLNPKWYEDFNLAVKHVDEESLEIFVHNGEKTEERHHECLGKNIVRLKDITPEESMTIVVDLLLLNGRYVKELPGTVLIKLVYKPFPLHQIPTGLYVEGTLKVIIHKGGNFKVKNHTKLLVRVLFHGEERKTELFQCEKNNQSPEWGSVFVFSLEKPPINEILFMEVSSTSWTGQVFPEESLGYVDINLMDVVNDGHIDKLYDLIDSTNGQLHVELQWITSH